MAQAWSQCMMSGKVNKWQVEKCDNLFNLLLLMAPTFPVIILSFRMNFNWYNNKEQYMVDKTDVLIFPPSVDINIHLL